MDILAVLGTIAKDWSLLVTAFGFGWGCYKLYVKFNAINDKILEMIDHNGKLIEAFTKQQTREHDAIVAALKDHVHSNDEHDRRMATELAVIRDRLERK